MPVTLDPDPQPLDHIIELGADNDRALILRDRTLSFKDLRSRVACLAAWLSSQASGPSSRSSPGQDTKHATRVASWIAKGELACLLPVAASRAGLVYVPINPLLKRAQVSHILADCGARLLIATPSRLKSLDSSDLPDECEGIDDASLYTDLDAFEDALPPSSADPDALCAILYTSGSTGKPKGVMLSHANLWLGAVSVAHYQRMESDDVTLAVLPLSFDYGQNQIFSAWTSGGCVVPFDYLFPRDVAKACAQHQITTLAAVPPLWVQLSEIEWDEGACAPLRRLTNSGGALTVDLVGDLRKMFPQAQIFPMYGLTEAFRSTFLDPDLVDSHPTSMGRAIPFAEIMVIGDDGDVAKPDEEGELVHCGPLVAQGYWQDAQRTAERFKPAPAASEYGGIAVWSGDRVRRDHDGLLYFVGRRDAMIKSAGNRISPQEVEDAALATGLVSQAVALGVKDERLGQAVHLIVRPEKGSNEAGSNEAGSNEAGPNEANSEEAEKLLRKALARELPNFMQPQLIHWRENMPLNPNGKVDRVALAQEIGA